VLDATVTTSDVTPGDLSETVTGVLLAGPGGEPDDVEAAAGEEDDDPNGDDGVSGPVAGATWSDCALVGEVADPQAAVAPTTTTHRADRIQCLSTVPPAPGGTPVHHRTCGHQDLLPEFRSKLGSRVREALWFERR
jgi:hypothetical protein